MKRDFLFFIFFDYSHGDSVPYDFAILRDHEINAVFAFWYESTLEFPSFLIARRLGDFLMREDYPGECVSGRDDVRGN